MGSVTNLQIADIPSLIPLSETRKRAAKIRMEWSDGIRQRRNVPDWRPPDEDICGFCGEPEADKIPHPVQWPGEKSANTEFVHAECEQEECKRAHALLSDNERRHFLRTL